MNCHPNHQPLQRRAQAGFTLIEALVALLVVSFGMLAIAGMQTTLARSSDLAKQRSEAVRLAQIKMEQLRSFDSIVSGSGTWNYSTDVVSGADAAVTPTNSNTAFTRSWTVTGTDGVTAAGANDAQKWIHVLVQWADRSSTTLNQSVRLDSTIARNNPTALKGLFAGQAQPKVRQPKNRNLNIPYPAVTLGGGTQSAFIPPPGGVAYVFDNATGNILSSCPVPPTATITSLSRIGSTVTVLATGHSFVSGNKVEISGVSVSAFNGTFTVVSATAGVSFTYTLSPPPLAAAATGGTAKFQLVEGLDLASSGLTCTTFGTPAYLLSGYVRFFDGSNPSAVDAQDPNGTTRDLVTATPLTIAASGTGKSDPVYTCYAQRQKVVSASNVNPAAISSMTRSGGVVTVTTSGSHGFPVGVLIATEGLSDFTFEGSFEITTVGVPNNSTLTYLQPGPDAGPITGTASSKIKLIQQITLSESDPVPSGYGGQPISTFVSYACVVTPYDDDSVPATPNAWWGKVTLNPSGWALGTTSSTYRVCRYSGDYKGGGLAGMTNSQHPQYFRRVTGALDSQNFLVIRGDQNCPGDVPVDFGGNSVSDLFNTNTVPHQPTGVLSYQCTNSSCNSQSGPKTTIEDSNLTLPIAME